MGGYSQHGHRHRQRRPSPSAPAFVRYTVLALAAILIVTLGWRGIRWTMHPRAAATTGYAPSPAGPQSRSSLWQLEFTQTLEGAANDAAAGSMGAAEMGVDRADSMITTARVLNSGAPADFFAPALAEFDHIVRQHPDDQRLFEHVTLARISLAELRSAQNPDPPAAASYNYYGGEPAGGGGGTGDKPYMRQEAQPNDSKRVSIGAPREIAANQTLNPAAIGGGNFVDATLMPDTSEILLPPASRAFADNIRVENLTFAGAAQTLDGIRWRNVIFIGTRLRYEGGPLDLQNVQFIRCRFGFVNDDRGARLASAIANGKTSLTIE
jgi:hypothetical protein